MKYKKVTILLFVFGCVSNTLFSQNLLSPIWKISIGDTSLCQDNLNKTSSNNINLLLSWERQGYYWRSGKGILSQKFILPDNYKSDDFILAVSLQCDVESIYINGKYVGGNLPSQFWSDKRGVKTECRITGDKLKIGGENTISILASNFTYTGGKSFNTCSLYPSKTICNSELKVSVPIKEHIYSVEDKNAAINIEYKAHQNGSVELYIVSDFHDTLVHKTFSVNAGEGVIPFNFTRDINRPGFYECTAIMKDIGFTGAVRWFTISPDKIECSQKTIPYFKKYWNGALDELKTVAPEFELKKSETLSAGSRDGYIVEMKSLGGLTIRGYYFVPRTGGRHAAILHVPGYGYGFDEGKPFINSNDSVAEFAICVRGHGISADVFNPGFDVPGIWGYKLCSETENAYRSIYMDCVRAVDFLFSRSEIDTSKIYVMGGSQGGGLAIATAGLCHDKIKALAYFDPFMTDTRDQLKIRVMCNNEIKSYLDYYNNECSFEDALRIQDYIDVKGFAEWIECPVFFTTALFDDDCPPHMGFSVYNRIKTSKIFKIYPDDSHLGESGNYNDMKKFLLDQ